MKYLIWGTGKATRDFLDITKQYFKENEVVALIDNDSQKYGKISSINNYYVISPEEIKNYKYDKILICSSYENEIKKQMTEKLKITEDKIIGRQKMMEEIIIPTYESIYRLSSESRIVLVGNKKAYQNISAIYKDIFMIQGFVDETCLNDLNKYQYNYILLTGDSLSKENLYTENELIKQLTETYKISEKKILTHDVYVIYKDQGKIFSYGEENSDKKFMVIKPGRKITGLGTIAIFVADKIKIARKNGYIPIVDMMSYENQYLEKNEVGKVNAWEKFFKQPDSYNLNDIKNSKHLFYTYLGAVYSNDNRSKRDMPVMQDELQTKALLYKKRLFKKNKKVLGVLFRGTDYVNLKPHGHYIQPDLNMMIEKIKEKEKEWGAFDAIYICTEVEEAIKCFEDAFSDRIYYYPQVRFSSSMHGTIAETIIGRENDTFYRGADYWIALECLADCNSLIAGSCGGTTVALALNDNKYEHKYIFNLGIYD